MSTYILADITDIMQSPHPVFGVSIGLCLLLFVLFKVFSQNQTQNSPVTETDLLLRRERKARIKCRDECFMGDGSLMGSFHVEMMRAFTLNESNFTRLSSKDGRQVEKDRVKQLLKTTIEQTKTNLIELKSEESRKNSVDIYTLFKYVDEMELLYNLIIDGECAIAGFATASEEDKVMAEAFLMKKHVQALEQLVKQIDNVIINLD